MYLRLMEAWPWLPGKSLLPAVLGWQLPGVQVSLGLLGWETMGNYLVNVLESVLESVLSSQLESAYCL